MKIRKPPKRILRRDRGPLGNSMGMALFGKPEDLGGGSVLLVVPRVGEVRKLPPGYELSTCQDCSKPVWVNAGFMENFRRKGLVVRVSCSTCSMGGPF